MKRILPYLLLLSVVVAIFFIIFSCQKSKRETLVIGMNVEYPPFESRVDTEFVGIDIEIIKRLSELAGFDYEIMDLDFEQLIPSLQSGKIDMIISAYSVTEERKQLVDYSVPYFTSKQALLKRSDNPAVISKLEDLAAYRVGTQNLTTGAKLLNEKLIATNLMPRKMLQTFGSNAQTLAALLNGEVDFAIFDHAPAQSFTQSNPLTVAFEYATNEQYAIAFRKNSPHRDKINKALREMLVKGEIDDIIGSFINSSQQ